MLRPGRDDDAAGIVRLITDCWSEYPGCVMDLDGENPELRALASYFARSEGALWVAEDAGEIVGLVGTKSLGGGEWELCRMYVAARMRGTGLSDRLAYQVVEYARDAGGQVLRLWSDTRFDRAHRFYERHGFVRDGAIRPLFDRSNSIEYAYSKPINGVVVRVLDAAAAASAARSLGRVLSACVENGASISFMPPFGVDEGEAFYRRLASQVANGGRVLLGGWVNGTLAGTVSLDLAMPPNQPHRGEVQKLLVHPSFRRRGLARALMLAVEDAARGAGRWLLTLDTLSGDAGERVYRAMGWVEVGEIPEFALLDGAYHGTRIFWRKLERGPAGS